MLDVLIAGAGIGGLALAGGLVRDGLAVRVLEAAPGLREGGAAVTIYSNGAAALAALGAPLPDGIGGRIDRLEARDERDRPIFRFDLTVLHRRTGFPVLTVPRNRLLRHLADGLPDGTIRYGHPVASAGAGKARAKAAPSDQRTNAEGLPNTNAEGGSNANAEGGPERAALVGVDGTVHRADVVVGADGARSAVRGGPPAREVGWTTWQGLTPVLPEIAAGTTARLYVGPAGLVGLMPAGNGLLQWWFDSTEAEPDLRARFAAYPAPVRTLLASYADTDLGCFPHVVHEVPDAWGAGRTTLLGDAAHAFPPSQAQGANQALEDAWLLRAAIQAGGTAAHLRAYERTRARRVRRVSRMAARETTNKPVNPLTRRLASVIPPALGGQANLRLIRGFSSVLSGDRL
ncbi:FAD-dependent monooxygenase [Asanoa sp. WMMD1127]|uniref:FAD-dependent monooxygenase n=1 Tax=Asanoa sp. WMMD1127 TaxID=3016107 RepID=UPI002415FE85|nr:FAD-dependent monooxygenase [Asanoa sp. WMMD1127]MDG4824214.1 FAD-dependent monooxygenase [Asanoa sp. WMMD1127]